MRRTKQWWAGLNKLERSELYALEHRLYRPNRCGACGEWFDVWYHRCRSCDFRWDELIKKADSAVEHSQGREVKDE